MNRIVNRRLDEGNFAPFGRILSPRSGEAPEVSVEDIFEFFVTFRESTGSWQIGYLKQWGRVVNKLESHPNTPEVFAPVSGESILLLTTEPAAGEIAAFKLDKPVVLRRGIWHGVIALSREANILIVENSDVLDYFYELAEEINEERVSGLLNS